MIKFSTLLFGATTTLLATTSISSVGAFSVGCSCQDQTEDDAKWLKNEVLQKCMVDATNELSEFFEQDFEIEKEATACAGDVGSGLLCNFQQKEKSRQLRRRWPPSDDLIPDWPFAEGFFRRLEEELSYREHTKEMFDLRCTVCLHKASKSKTRVVADCHGMVDV